MSKISEKCRVNSHSTRSISRNCRNLQTCRIFFIIYFSKSTPPIPIEGFTTPIIPFFQLKILNHEGSIVPASDPCHGISTDPDTVRYADRQSVQRGDSLPLDHHERSWGKRVRCRSGKTGWHITLRFQFHNTIEQWRFGRLHNGRSIGQQRSKCCIHRINIIAWVRPSPWVWAKAPHSGTRMSRHGCELLEVLRFDVVTPGHATGRDPRLNQREGNLQTPGHTGQRTDLELYIFSYDNLPVNFVVSTRSGHSPVFNHLSIASRQSGKRS
jgi:hypothetical protein